MRLVYLDTSVLNHILDYKDEGINLSLFDLLKIEGALTSNQFSAPLSLEVLEEVLMTPDFGDQRRHRLLEVMRRLFDWSIYWLPAGKLRYAEIRSVIYDDFSFKPVLSTDGLPDGLRRGLHMLTVSNGKLELDKLRNLVRKEKVEHKEMMLEHREKAPDEVVGLHHDITFREVWNEYVDVFVEFILEVELPKDDIDQQILEETRRKPGIYLYLWLFLRQIYDQVTKRQEPKGSDAWDLKHVSLVAYSDHFLVHDGYLRDVVSSAPQSTVHVQDVHSFCSGF